jgi:hypothetical protein
VSMAALSRSGVQGKTGFQFPDHALTSGHAHSSG